MAFSGGLDSTVLLHALASATPARVRGLRAWHVHHGLHDQADEWAAHCRAICATLAVPVTVSRASVARDGGCGREAAARDARRAVFADGLDDGEALALAHHRDDQAETFLLRALRASGPDGLGAMESCRRFGRGWLWRPLLEVPRAALEAYAARHGLHWIEDSSNSDQSLDRNFLRHGVLPLLRERWPHAAAALARSAELCGEAGQLLDEQDDRALTDAAGPEPMSLSRASLLQLSAPRRARVLRRWIDVLGLPSLPAEGVAQVESVLLPARADASATFQWHGAAIRAWRDRLHADWLRPPLPDGWHMAWNGIARLRLPGGGVLSLLAAAPEGDRAQDAAGEHAGIAGGFGRTLVVHARAGGERITLPGRDHGHSLKQVLQDAGVPPWQRATMPLLSTGEGELLAAGDRIAAARFEQWLRKHDARLVWTADARPTDVD